MQAYSYLRFTGTRSGSQPYPAPGYPKIAFGQNPTHFQQLVTLETADYLKRKYGKELLEIPLNMSRAVMRLDTLVATSALLPEAMKRNLAGAYRTLGEVIADPDAIYSMFDQYEAPELLNVIREHFGLPLLPQPVRPVEALPDEERHVPRRQKKAE